jgi:hypothetical protein
MPILIIFLITLITTPCISQTSNESPDGLWEVGDRRWTIEEEHQFEKWVDTTMTEDFFLHYKIPTDCADAVYAVRWIYARMAGLPAAATTVDGRLIGHWSTDWKHLPTHPEWHKDGRFRAALFYLFPRTWTGTLPLDTYPIRVSPDSVRPGTLFLVSQSHTGIIGHVFVDGSQAHPLQTWESALPVKMKKLELRYFFSGKPESKARSGLVRFRWPVLKDGEWGYLPVTEQPFYSEEQYAPAFHKGSVDFNEAVAKRIDPTEYDPHEKMIKVMGTITRLLRERVPIVREGCRRCENGGCPQGSESWEIYNTSGRDGMIGSLMDHLSRLIESNHPDKVKAKELMEAVSIAISDNRSVTLYDLYQNHLWLSPDPGESIEARWGLKKCEMISAQTQIIKNTIAFIERAYRRKDPQYARYAIWQQQRELQRLSANSINSECRAAYAVPEKTLSYSPYLAESMNQHRPLRNCGVIRADIRAAKDSVSFIEKTYRKKDPGYADFSIRQQQQELLRLSEEWTRSACRDPSLTSSRGPGTKVKKSRQE